MSPRLAARATLTLSIPLSQTAQPSAEIQSLFARVYSSPFIHTSLKPGRDRGVRMFVWHSQYLDSTPMRQHAAKHDFWCKGMLSRSRRLGLVDGTSVVAA